MTNTQFNRLHKIIKKGMTVSQLKALCKVHSLTVQCTSQTSYSSTKSDYIDAVMDLLVTYEPTSPSGFVYNRRYLLNVVFFPSIKDELIKELI